MFSQDAKNHIAACRICFMCRHHCPIGLATGKEAHTPRGRAILAQYSDGSNQGAEIFKESVIDFYQCALCNACADWCETSYEPAKFIREARREAVAQNVLPEKVAPVVDQVLSTGSLFAEKEDIAASADGLPKTADVLLVLGDTARAKTPQIAKAVVSLMKKAGVDFTLLRDEPPVGAMMYDLIGETAEVQATANTFAQAVAETNCKHVVVLDPADAKILLADYPRWDCTLSAEVHTATAYVAQLLKENKLVITKKAADQKVCYHDPCRLARDLDETEPAREIIAAMGAEMHEIFLNKTNTRCCGGECVAAHSPEITKMTANARLVQAKDTGAETMLCACPGCYDVFSAGRTENSIEIEDIFVLLDRCC